MTPSSNPFESLRNPGTEDAELIRDNFETIEVYNDRTEILKILVADAGNGRWAFGYDLYFFNGRHADRLPSLEMGYCSSRENAILYFLGYIKSYSTMFSADAIDAVDKMIAQYIAPKLF